jgi:methylenetetrahydrofolate dehydrogenase (NADP+)/methenyltetrahydrofolate cyclohydrolase
MAATLLEGKSIAENVRASLLPKIESVGKVLGRAPKLAALQIGDDNSSSVYIKSQKRWAEALGIDYELRSVGDGASQRDAEEAIESMNIDPSIDAVILQMPLPKSMDAAALAARISPVKDADCMHPQNIGRVMSGRYLVGPCTAMAVMELIASAGLKLYGKETVVVGHSDIVGKPLAMMLINQFATTTVCHIATSESGNLAAHVGRADLLVVAVGKAGIIKGGWVKEGAAVIDVGINTVGGKIVGDVEFDSAFARASIITPVPGGVGPLTGVMLMKNTIELCKGRL